MSMAAASDTSVAADVAATTRAGGSKRQRQRRAATLRPPGDLGNGLETSIHACSKTMSAELKLVIPEQADRIQASGKTDQPPLIAVATAQHTDSDLAEWGDDAANQKDFCLERVRHGKRLSVAAKQPRDVIGLTGPAPSQASHHCSRRACTNPVGRVGACDHS